MYTGVKFQHQEFRTEFEHTSTAEESIAVLLALVWDYSLLRKYVLFLKGSPLLGLGRAPRPGRCILCVHSLVPAWATRRATHHVLQPAGCFQRVGCQLLFENCSSDLYSSSKYNYGATIRIMPYEAIRAEQETAEVYNSHASNYIYNP